MFKCLDRRVVLLHFALSGALQATRTNNLPIGRTLSIWLINLRKVYCVATAFDRILMHVTPSHSGRPEVMDVRLVSDDGEDDVVDLGWTHDGNVAREPQLLLRLHPELSLHRPKPVLKSFTLRQMIYPLVADDVDVEELEVLDSVESDVEVLVPLLCVSEVDVEDVAENLQVNAKPLRLSG
eukprot:5933307-Amphidinium_carterae.2